MSSPTAARPPSEIAARVAAFIAAGAATTLELALYDIRLPGRPGDDRRRRAARRRGTRGRGAAALQRRLSRPPAIQPPPSTRPSSWTSCRSRIARRARDPRPDAPQVRRPRRRGGLDRLGELDDRLVDAPGERARQRRVAEARARAYARQLRGALGAARRRAQRPGRADADRPRRRRHGAAVVHARPRRRSSRRRSRRRSAARRGGCGSPRR